MDADRIAEESKQQHLMNTQVKEAARLTKHTRVIGRIQQLFQSSHGREVLRHLRKEGDKLRQLNEQVALEEAKSARATAQIQKVAKLAGIVENFACYKKGEQFGKSQTLKEMQVEKVEDMLEKAAGENKQLQPSSVEDILKYALTLAPQEKDAYFRATSQVVSGGADALHPEPIGGFMGTVSTVHQNKPGRKKLSLRKSSGSLADAKKAGKANTGTSQKDRETIVPTFKDVTDSNLADAEIQGSLGATCLIFRDFPMNNCDSYQVMLKL